MTDAWIEFDYALIRLVPCVHRGTTVNVGVVLHAPTRHYLRALFLDDLAPLAALAPGVDLGRVAAYLTALAAVADGTRGPLAALAPSERFHWLTAPRSDILQASPTHPGLAVDLDAAIAQIFSREVALHTAAS